jgi:hypothetical protein
MESARLSPQRAYGKIFEEFDSESESAKAEANAVTGGGEREGEYRTGSSARGVGLLQT